GGNADLDGTAAAGRRQGDLEACAGRIRHDISRRALGGAGGLVRVDEGDGWRWRGCAGVSQLRAADGDGGVSGGEEVRADLLDQRTEAVQANGGVGIAGAGWGNNLNVDRSEAGRSRRRRRGDGERGAFRGEGDAACRYRAATEEVHRRTGDEPGSSDG